MNDMFQEHKRQLDYGFKIAVAELTAKGIKQVELIESKTEKVIEIPAYETTYGRIKRKMSSVRRVLRQKSKRGVGLSERK